MFLSFFDLGKNALKYFESLESLDHVFAKQNVNQSILVFTILYKKGVMIEEVPFLQKSKIKIQLNRHHKENRHHQLIFRRDLLL